MPIVDHLRRIGRRSRSADVMGVGAVFTAVRQDQELQARTYEIVAWFPLNACPPDVRELQIDLEEMLTKFDREILPQELAAMLMEWLDGCVGVEVNLPVERLFAKAY